MRAAIIINPRSGAHRKRVTAHGSRQDHARRCADLAGVPLEIRMTTKRSHAAELAAELIAAGMDRIIVWGGDGTVNEAAGPLFGTKAALGIVRGGSGDGLAGSLGIPRDPDAAIRLALTAQPRPIDVGWLGGRHFLNVAGIGFDAEVGRRFNLRARRGLGGYIDESLRAVWRYRSVSYRLDVDGQRLEGPRFVIVFANGRQYGSGISIAPDAELSDGLINMVLVSGGGPFRQLWRARRLGIRPLHPAEGLRRQQLKSAEISGTELVCHVDGETFEAEGTVELRVTPGALNVIAGAG